MKKFITIITMAICGLAYSQWYGAVGFSTSNGGKVKDNSYTSIEVGYSKNKLSYGLVLGSTDLGFNNYWYEGKVAYTLTDTTVNPYLTAGVGSYFNNPTLFLEYGIGLSTSWQKLTPFVQISNFDGKTYLSVGTSFNL